MAHVGKRVHKMKDGRDIIIRDVSMLDAERIIEINKSVLEEGHYMMREPEEANYTIEGMKSEFSIHINNPGSIYIIAEVDRHVIGYLEFTCGSFRRTSHAGMFSIFIIDGWREFGAGKLLVQSLLDWAQSSPLIEKVTLATFSTNARAERLYRSLGFIEEGRCPNDMKLKDGTYIDSVLMYKFVK